MKKLPIILAFLGILMLVVCLVDYILGDNGFMPTWLFWVVQIIGWLLAYLGYNSSN
jgi:hypothetical protein